LHLSGPGARRAAVLGRPIGHSLSPVLHRAAYRALGLSGWTYDAIDCGADELAALVARAGPEWAGFSVTMPGKRAALEAADRRMDAAELVGAANTLVPGPDGWTAANTDVDGIVGALSGAEAVAGDGTDSGVVLLGAGGTAQAAVVALRHLQTNRIDIAGTPGAAVQVLVRDPDRTGALQATADRAGMDLAVHILDSPAATRQLDRAGLLISTLPAHAADPLAGRVWSPRVVLLDAVYADWPTALARAVTGAGGRAISGTEMLLHQAAEQVRLMTGHAAPLDAMRAALAT
jgi:shikimate dehydrogenase